MSNKRMVDRAKLLNGIGANVHYSDTDPLGSYSALLAYINDFPAEEDSQTDITPKLRRTIAIDFDGCLCSEEWPQIGVPNWDIINVAKAEQESGSALILWTCREGKLLADAVEACRSWGLEFDAINSSTTEWIAAWGGDTRKVGATEYWDDRAVNQPLKAAATDLINRLEDAVFQMERGVHNSGHIAAILDAIKALK